ncbi:3-oxoacyl-ACP reductase family protein [Streptomyces sp. H10-C2]|uniref:SDR family NAD(P)-dependent oxidoreductase n=1 Tax=unclassified Streptomyces TaxID=2593676 RepID=UPI0024BBDF70|nr:MULTISPECIES: 3-oxoacyl-ACP reductase family protein [unclassified Streptomyces]MDJ0346144.1 3-oxoacyl-ACP reductase family protein [Streptomyces sp. PH10-H1]MDJ0371594.1 3-oxoacyl-ACP reductase family protein [Streptomyces sp. H10-C2]
MTAVLDGKVAFVTGGSRGIGEAVALRLAEEGADVALTYRDGAERAADVVDRVKALGRRAWAVRADSSDPIAVRDAVDQAAAEFGRLDIVVNNVGIGVLGPIEDMSLEDIDRVLNINVRAPFLVSQAAVRHMTEGGRIINIGSCMAERVAFPGGSLYTTSKTALTGLTKSLARELGPRGIRVNLIHPGPTETDMNPSDGPGADMQKGFTALGHYGQPSDVAATVAHLAGDAGRYITGATIAVDGGFTA